MESDQAEAKDVSGRWFHLSRIEILIVLLIIAILVALLRPSVQQAGSGSAVFPVRVFVFDAVNGVPIEGARVGIIRAYGMYSLNDTTENLSRWPAPPHESEILTMKTDEKGVAILNHEFDTGTGTKHPKSQSHLRRGWVLVSADGYGSITIPVGNDSRETAKIREQGEILVPIGLVPQEQ